MNYWQWNKSKTQILYVNGLKGELIAAVDPSMIDLYCCDSVLDQLISLYGWGE